MIKVTKPNRQGVCLIFKNYTINQTTLPLDIEQYISETDVAFAVNSLVAAIPHSLVNQLEHQLERPA